MDSDKSAHWIAWASPSALALDSARVPKAGLCVDTTMADSMTMSVICTDMSAKNKCTLASCLVHVNVSVFCPHSREWVVCVWLKLIFCRAQHVRFIKYCHDQNCQELSAVQYNAVPYHSSGMESWSLGLCWIHCLPETSFVAIRPSCMGHASCIR